MIFIFNLNTKSRLKICHKNQCFCLGELLIRQLKSCKITFKKKPSKIWLYNHDISKSAITRSLIERWSPKSSVLGGSMILIFMNLKAKSRLKIHHKNQ